MSSQNYDCVCMMHLKAFQMYYPEKFDSLKFAKIISPVWRDRVSHYKNYGTQIRYNNVISDFPWVNFKESSEGIDQEPNKNGLLKKLLMTSTGDQDVNLYSLLEVSAPEYLDPFYYDGRCSVMHGGKDAKIDLIHATMTGTRLVFDHETTGLDFWKSIKSNTECNNCSDDPDMLCKGMFIKECHALLSYECNERKSLKYSDKYHPEDFLFCKGVLWQLHVNPAMLNQWLMAALHVIMQFEKQTSMLRYMPVPLQMEEVVKELLVFLRDLRKRISYGFLLIGYQVKIHPEKDKQVNMLIREDIVPQSLASLKLLLNDEKIQNFILKLPHAILAARKKGTFGKDVYMNAKNFTVSDEVDKFDNIFSFKFWTGARENLFGTLKTEIDDLKSKINKSETHASVENVLLIEESNDDVLDALKMHFPDPVCSKANIDKLNKDLCTDQSRLYTKSCLFSLLLEEHRTIVSHLFAKCLTDEDYLHFKMTETELNEFINLKQGFEGQKLLDIARDKYIEEWDGKRFPVDILYIRESPSNPREGILQELRSQILMDVDETSKLYPSWGFVFNILPFLNLSLSKCGDGGLKDKFTDACGKALVKVFRGDRVAWKLHPEDAMENSKWFLNSLLQPKKVLIQKLKAISYFVSHLNPLIANVLAPISMFAYLLVNATLSHAKENDISDCPCKNIMVVEIIKISFPWAMKVASWLNAMMFSVVQATVECVKTPNSGKLKSLLLTLSSVIELVILYYDEKTPGLSGLYEDFTKKVDTLKDAYLELIGTSRQSSKGKTTITGWQKLGVLLFLIYEIRKLMSIPAGYNPPSYYPRDAKLALKYFAAKDLKKFKRTIIPMCVDSNRQNLTLVTFDDIKNSRNLFDPYLSKMRREKIRSWDEDLLLLVKHCRYCGKVGGNLQMCSACVDNDDFPDVNWFCGEACEEKAFKHCRHGDEHEDFILSRIKI